MENNTDPGFLTKIADSTRSVAKQLNTAAKLKHGHTVIIGCSTSEITGKHIWTCSNIEIGTAVFKALYEIFSECGIHLAAQCCEHLNRVIIIERQAANGREIVNAIPKPEAG